MQKQKAFNAGITFDPFLRRRFRCFSRNSTQGFHVTFFTTWKASSLELIRNEKQNWQSQDFVPNFVIEIYILYIITVWQIYPVISRWTGLFGRSFCYHLLEFPRLSRVGMYPSEFVLKIYDLINRSSNFLNCINLNFLRGV